jgi:hypothetical protein
MHASRFSSSNRLSAAAREENDVASRAAVRVDRQNR